MCLELYPILIGALLRGAFCSRKHGEHVIPTPLEAPVYMRVDAEHASQENAKHKL